MSQSLDLRPALQLFVSLCPLKVHLGLDQLTWAHTDTILTHSLPVLDSVFHCLHANRPRLAFSITVLLSLALSPESRLREVHTSLLSGSQYSAGLDVGL